MARYYFDLHADGLSEWDDDGEECRDPATIVQRAGHRLARLVEAAPSLLHRSVVASVRDAAGRHIVTVTLGRHVGLRIAWAGPHAETREASDGRVRPGVVSSA